jgi:hypothetical protein
MASTTTGTNLSARSLELRARAGMLLLKPKLQQALPDKDWCFLESVIVQHSEYSEAQWEWLHDIEWRAITQTGVDGLSIPMLAETCMTYLADFPPDDAEFIRSILRSGATELYNAPYHRLLSLYQQIEPLDRRQFAE